jgi:hypothetical protein
MVLLNINYIKLQNETTMIKKKLFLLILATLPLSMYAQKSIDVTIINNGKGNYENLPFVLDLKKYDANTHSAVVLMNGTEIPCQLDDTNGDGTYDELCFIADIDKKMTKKFIINLSETGKPKNYPSKVYVEMMLENKKIKEANKQDLYISNLSVERGVNPYWMIHHHGAAFESELAAYRIYFDHRQTVDIYGKVNKGLELKATQFYPDKQQKDNGSGDDVLWVGNTLGLGTLRGFDGSKPLMLEDVEKRSQRIIANGPLRTIVEVKDNGWRPDSTKEPIDMTTLYTLYAGHRDCSVDITFSRPANGYRFCTGLINVKNSTEYSDNKGLRGCWGKDWPVSAKDSVGHKQETVGLGIYIPENYVIKELPADKDNYPFIVGTSTDRLHYDITFGSDNENFGYHNSKEWFKYLSEWDKSFKTKRDDITIKIKMVK